MVVFRDKRAPYTSRYFASSSYGGKDGARAAAEKWQEEMSHSLGLTKNRYRIMGNHAEVQLTQGRIMLVDIEDIPFVEQEYWCVKVSGGQRDHFYAACRSGPFHRLLTGFEVVDHINRDTFDNRRGNLRSVDATGNARNRKRSRNNTSGVGGVSQIFVKGKPHWDARWCEAGKRVHRQFSVAKYGEQEAKRRAIQTRREKCEELGINNE